MKIRTMLTIMLLVPVLATFVSACDITRTRAISTVNR